jgi:hypothetical protein
MEKEPFAMIPVFVIADGRLTKTDLRVYAAIVSFRNADTKKCFPSRERIAQRSCLAACKISTSITTLIKFGYISISTENGRRRYHFHKPDVVPKVTAKLVTPPVTKEEIPKLTGDVTLQDTDSETNQVTGSGTHNKEIKHINQQTIQQTTTQSADVLFLKKILWPSQFSSIDDQLENICASADIGFATTQQIADVCRAELSKRQIENPLGYVTKLVQSVKNGGFNPFPGLDYAKQRESRERDEAERIAAANARAERAKNPPDRSVGRAESAALKKTLIGVNR